MSIRIMKRRCVHCGKEFTYNPSVGNFGLVCPKCGMPQPTVMPDNAQPPRK